MIAGIKARSVGLAFGLGLVLGVNLLTGCATPPPPTPSPPPPAPAPPPPPPPPPAPPAAPEFVATPGLTPKERIVKTLKLLGNGESGQAKAELEALLRDDPKNELGAVLLSQLTKDPHELLGEKNFSYKIQPGESLSIIAERYLGDRFLFYALARYNNIAAPNKAEVGETILVPGVAEKVVKAPTRRRKAQTEEEAIDARLKPSPAPPPTPVAKAPDPARAQALRGRALVLLNSGSARRAVGLLREALEADPGNALITADLARAERIEALVPQ